MRKGWLSFVFFLTVVIAFCSNIIVIFVKDNPIIFYTRNISLGILYIWTLVNILQLFWIVREKILWLFRKMSLFLLVISLTLVIPITIHYKYYPSVKIDEGTWLQIYCTYLTFIGAFGLGYFLYLRDEVNREKEIRNKARRLYDSIFEIINKTRSLESFAELGYIFRIPSNWRDDFLDIYRFVKHESNSLKSELSYFFDVINSINLAIEKKDGRHAKQIYDTFTLNEQYSNKTFNIFEVVETLLSIAHSMPQPKPWKEIENQRTSQLASKYFDVVNLWIGNYLLKNGLTFCDNNILEHELVDWLLLNPELRDWAKYPSDKRKISEMVFQISLEMKKRSETLNYIWAEYSFKETPPNEAVTPSNIKKG
jgi:hypothetical protein